MPAPRILLLARDATVQRVMVVLLQHFGYEVQAVGDALSATAELLRRKPAVVVVDAELGARAWSFVREVKANASTRGLPVIGIHAANRAVVKAAALAGCEVCLPMPLDTHALLALLATHAPLE